MSIPAFEEIIEQNDQTEARSDHLDKLRELVGNVYPNKFARSAVSGVEDTITRLKHCDKVAGVEAKMAVIKDKLVEGQRPDPKDKEPLNEDLKALGNVRIAGRLTTPTRGNFVHLTDGMSKLQVYCNKKGPLALIKNDGAETLDAENGWALWRLLDHGDFVGVEGYLFITNTGELSVHVEKLQFLAKAMLPMPDKMHGIADAEIRQRQRYYDLIGSSLRVKTDEEIEEEKRTGIKHLTTREVFQTRAKIISSMRRFLEDHEYVEVETPMLTPKATGAAAKPFKTHHNALDIDLYARIAPELYLKRLVVGGFEKVYELNRNFRNEGISYKHNPEFTMLEFYCAYMDVAGMMNFCEELMRQSVQKATGGLQVVYEIRPFSPDPTGKFEKKVIIDFSQFTRMTMREAIAVNWHDKWFPGRLIEKLDAHFLDHPANILRLIEMHHWWTAEGFPLYCQNFNTVADESKSETEIGERLIALLSPKANEKWSQLKNIFGDVTEQFEIGNKLAELFELVAEENLIQPTFIIDFPKSISPLSKASPENPNIAERFELFINGMEVANGFSELNDPKEQYERFVDQMSERERGDEEAMILDEDYIRALSYGMPPAAGIGIGIDRLVMLLTNKHSIRDVILFPHMRPEKRHEEE
jgi:lysyl-tRNA synthetase class 2